MKKMILFVLMFALLLTGCGAEAAVDNRIQVSLMIRDGCSVEENGLWIEPGADAVFRLRMEEGCSLASTDYAGSYSAELKDGYLELTLKEVRRPVRVNLSLTKEYSTITYDPNGGEGDVVVKTYDRTEHLRPNTENGQEMFRREGHSLVSWNTEPDGSGIRVGLGSRVTVEDALTLYAQWMPWTEESAFEYRLTQYKNITISGYTGDHETIVIPEKIEGYPVTAITAGAFENCSASHLVLPHTMDRIAPDAFQGAALETVVLYDNIQVISDDVFSDCQRLQTLYINAVEAPWGYDYRKESVYADKVDMLIMAQGQKKMVFYGGCSVWYNLDGKMTDKVFGEEYTVLNMGLNGTINSEVQMQILNPYLEAGDVLVHTLELSSPWQLLIDRTMTDNDDKLWCGLEYNYDLFSLVDLRTVKGELDSLLKYLEKKKTETDYQDFYRDQSGHRYLDEFGCIPFRRTEGRDNLTDKVLLDLSYVNQDAMALLDQYYTAWQDRGITVYATYACLNMEAVPEDQRQNLQTMDGLIRDAYANMDGAVMISTLTDFLFENDDFYDTNYHLLTAQAQDNTTVWLRDLKAQMTADGLWEVGR